MKASNEAWAGFWRDEPDAASGATLANLPEPLQRRLDQPWRDLAVSLQTKAKVLDLATGGGIVLELLRRQRRDLDLLGVDSAAQLPKRQGMSLKGGVSTECLPFADSRFDAVTSRFGIEYGDLDAGASEAGRVLRPGGYLCLIIHHNKSNVVAHNRARREALQWAAHGSGWTEKALNVAKARRTLFLPTPPAFGTAPAEGAALFPGQSVAWEFLTGLKQLLDSGAPEGQITRLAFQADEEIVRLDALLSAACDGARLARLTAALDRSGIKLAPPRTIDEPDGALLAWLIEGRKL